MLLNVITKETIIPVNKTMHTTPELHAADIVSNIEAIHLRIFALGYNKF